MNGRLLVCAAALGALAAAGDDLPWKMEGATERTAASEQASDAWEDFVLSGASAGVSTVWGALVRDEWTRAVSEAKTFRLVFGTTITFR